MKNISRSLLKGLNLSASQLSVYLAALELGQATIQSLSRKSGVPRASIYRFIDELRERQLIEEIRKGGRNYFSATNPEQLVEIERARMQELDTIIPDLLAIQNRSRVHPRVRFFEGVEGIKSVYTDVLKERKTNIGFADFEHSYKLMRDFYESYFVPERKKRGLWFKAIVPDNPQVRKFMDINNQELREMRFMPGPGVKNEIFVYGDKLAIISFRASPPYAVLIEDEDIAASITEIWRVLWDKLPEE